MSRITIGLVDDQKLFLQSLATLIRSVPGFELVMEATDGNDCLDQLKKAAAPPQVILTDMEMPGMDGVELNRILHRDFPEVKVLLLSVHSSEKLIARMIEAGASGYLLKNCDKEELINAIRVVVKSGFYMNNNVLLAIQKKSAKANKDSRLYAAAELTAREKEVLLLLCKEFSNAEIAEQLFLSIRTVEGHRNNLLLKTGARNTAGLVLFAVKNGLYELLF